MFSPWAPALTLGHITFAAAAPAKPVQVASAAAISKATDVATTGSVTAESELAENCYLELVQEKTARGKMVTRRVHECD